ncbi:Hypothetical predicted protein [Pelobates cultripes]|uniref:Uncharacterized protein n=1 Tax=Pelobates cultripes TaxID=61616 RepID=A0AAD1T353_PELCU|nr:Hypothetical predicted protein [Pelobates cultripes]
MDASAQDQSLQALIKVAARVTPLDSKDKNPPETPHSEDSDDSDASKDSKGKAPAKLPRQLEAKEKFIIHLTLSEEDEEPFPTPPLEVLDELQADYSDSEEETVGLM